MGAAVPRAGPDDPFAPDQSAPGAVLRIATALGGAALIVRGAISAGPAFLAGLQAPATPLESIAAVVVLAVLAWIGNRVQVALDRRRTTA